MQATVHSLLLSQIRKDNVITNRLLSSSWDLNLMKNVRILQLQILELKSKARKPAQDQVPQMIVVQG